VIDSGRKLSDMGEIIYYLAVTFMFDLSGSRKVTVRLTSNLLFYLFLIGDI
jgi:hypothetical protein